MRYPATNSPAVEVFNGAAVQPVNNLRVIVGYLPEQPNLMQIILVDDPRLDDNSNIATGVNPHAPTHAWGGSDPISIGWRQLQEFRIIAYSLLSVYVYGGVLPRGTSTLQVMPQVVDLSTSIPSAGFARYALLSIVSTGTIVVTAGTPRSPIGALTIADLPTTPTGNFRIGAVQLKYGQTSISDTYTHTDILDLRWPQESMAGSPYTPFGTQSSNTVLAGPTTGAADIPAFRALVSADLPTHDIVALHTTSGRTAGQILQATNATTFGWSTNTLTISGNSTINGSLIGNMTGGGTVATGGFTLTVPATGTAALGTGTANGTLAGYSSTYHVAIWDTANTLTSDTLSSAFAWQPGNGAIVAQNVLTDATNKFARFVTGHYTNSAKGVIGFSITSLSATNVVQYGGG